MFVFLQAARSKIFIPYAQAHSSGSRLRDITGWEKLKYVLKRLDITQLSSPLHVSTAPFTFPSRLISQRGDKSRWTTMSSSRKTTLLRFGKSWLNKWDRSGKKNPHHKVSWHFLQVNLKVVRCWLCKPIITRIKEKDNGNLKRESGI